MWRVHYFRQSPNPSDFEFGGGCDFNFLWFLVGCRLFKFSHEPKLFHLTVGESGKRFIFKYQRGGRYTMPTLSIESLQQ